MKKKLAMWSVLLAFILVMLALSYSIPVWGKTGDTTKKEMEFTEKTHTRLLKDVPAPTVEHSQERRNLVRRLLTFNKADKISYIYLVSYGRVMAFYTVKGKVSSVNSLLTTPTQLLNIWGERYYLPSPQLDGSYGENGDAIFFFTTEDVYVEWNGTYMLCDQPLHLATEPEMSYVKVIE